MDARREFSAAPIAAMRRLAEFLHESGSKMKPADAAAQAINQWIAAAKGQYTGLRATPVRGYQWKCVFLPDGTQLRMRFDGGSFYARVEGDAIVYAGQRVSPRQMAIAIGGDGRNAWRDLALLLPGETKWVPASLLRRQSLEQSPASAVSPVEAMKAAADCMAETLKTALALVEHSNARALPHYERRVGRHRRILDLMEDDCKSD